MSYSNPKTVTYTRSLATTTTAWTVAPPPGCNTFRVVDIQASVTTTFVGAATLTVGVPSNPDAAGSLNIGTAVAGTALGWGAQFNKGTNPKVGTIDLSGTANAAAVTVPYPAALEVVGPASISFTAGSAGAAVAEVTLAWF